MKRAVVCLILSSIFFATSCIFEKNPTDQEYEIAVGDDIPDFTVTMNDGSVVTAENLRKGKSLIMFFHSDCPDCRGTL